MVSSLIFSMVLRRDLRCFTSFSMTLLTWFPYLTLPS